MSERFDREKFPTSRPGRPRTHPLERKACLIQLVVKEHTKDEIRAEAEKRGLTLSAYCRRLIYMARSLTASMKTTQFLKETRDA